jgi:hypothetical protein
MQRAGVAQDELGQSLAEKDPVVEVLVAADLHGSIQIEKWFNLREQGGSGLRRSAPDKVEIYVEMDQAIPHADDGGPWNLRMLLARLDADLAGSLPNDLEA